MCVRDTDTDSTTHSGLTHNTRERKPGPDGQSIKRRCLLTGVYVLRRSAVLSDETAHICPCTV